MTRIFFLIGILFIVLGFIYKINPGLRWLGHLPGDIILRRGDASFYFPVTTCLLLSLVLSAILFFFSRWLR